MDYKLLAKESLSGYRVLSAAIENLTQSIGDIDRRLASQELSQKEHLEERISLCAQRRTWSPSWPTAAPERNALTGASPY